MSDCAISCSALLKFFIAGWISVSESASPANGASVQTKISLQVELVDRKTNRNVWDHVAEREEPVGSKTVADVVQSLDRNLQHVVSETAAEIDKFLAARR